MKKTQPQSKEIGRKSGAVRSRDREATRDGIIQAVGRLLARGGFRALGINAVAKEAGVDKVLIYRYFGGMPELLKAFGESEEFWPSMQELAGGDFEAMMRRPASESVAALLINFARALRHRPLTQEIMAWETIEQNELTEVLKTVREDMAMRMLATAGANLDAVPGDITAITTLLSAAVSYLVLRARDTQIYNTLDIRSDQGWERLESAMATICEQCLRSR